MAAHGRPRSTAASLPEGLLQRIFEAEANEKPLLSLEELARAEAVCKPWRSLLRTRPLWLRTVELKGEGDEREMLKALWVAARAPQVERVVLTLDALPTPTLLVAVSFALRALLSGGARFMAVRCSVESGLEPYLPVISHSGHQLECLFIYCANRGDDAQDEFEFPGSQGAASGSSGSAAAATSASQCQGQHSSGGSEGLPSPPAAASGGAAGEEWDSSDDGSSEDGGSSEDEGSSQEEGGQRQRGVGLLLRPALGVHTLPIRELLVMTGPKGRVEISLPMPNLEVLSIDHTLSKEPELHSSAPSVVLAAAAGAAGGPLFPRLATMSLEAHELWLDASAAPALKKLELVPCGRRVHIEGLRGCTQLTSMWLETKPSRSTGPGSNFTSPLLRDAPPSLQELSLNLFEPPDRSMALALSSLTQLTGLLVRLFSPGMFGSPGPDSSAWPLPCRLLGGMRQLRTLQVMAMRLDDGASVLSSLPNLQELALPWACFEQLPPLPHLTCLRLGALPSTLQQEHLEQLAGMRLRCLVVAGEDGEGLGEDAGAGEALRQVSEALPGCAVGIADFTDLGRGLIELSRA